MAKPYKEEATQAVWFDQIEIPDLTDPDSKAYGFRVASLVNRHRPPVGRVVDLSVVNALIEELEVNVYIN